MDELEAVSVSRAAGAIPPPVIEPTIYCPDCGYVLDGLPEPRCPECGLAFDPDELRCLPSKGAKVLSAIREVAATLVGLFSFLGCLAILAMPILLPPPTRPVSAREKITQAIISRNGPISKALGSFRWDVGRYPTTAEGLAALFATSADDERYQRPYLERTFEELLDPWGSPFGYRSPGIHNPGGYDLWSYGPNQIDESGRKNSDDIKNWL